MRARNGVLTLSGDLLLQCIGQCEKHVRHLAHNAEVGVAEDGCGRVTVNGHDGFGRAHSHHMLEGSRDTAGNIEPRTDRGTRLADLKRPGGKSGFNRTAGSSDLPTHLVGQVHDQVPVRCVAPGAAGDYHIGVGQSHLSPLQLVLQDIDYEISIR